MNENFMKEEPVLPLITSMALPMVISMMVNSLYNIVDSFFVAQISEEAMTRYTAWRFPPCTELCLWLPALPLCRSF